MSEVNRRLSAKVRSQYLKRKGSHEIFVARNENTFLPKDWRTEQDRANVEDAHHNQCRLNQQSHARHLKDECSLIKINREEENNHRRSVNREIPKVSRIHPTSHSLTAILNRDTKTYCQTTNESQMDEAYQKCSSKYLDAQDEFKKTISTLSTITFMVGPESNAPNKGKEDAEQRNKIAPLNEINGTQKLINQRPKTTKRHFINHKHRLHWRHFIIII